MAKAAPPKPKPPVKAKPKADASEAKLHPAQKFAPGRVHRSQLKNAEYNPRLIDDFAAAELRRVLDEVGLLSALTWNKRSGNVVGGHQRLAALDALDKHAGGTGNYLLDVDVVDLSHKHEVRANIVLNNPSIQGDFDMKLFAELVAGPDAVLTLDDVHIQAVTAEEWAIGTDVESAFRLAAPETEDTIAAAAELRAMADARKAAGKEDYAGAPVAPDADAPHGRLEGGEAIRNPDKHAAVKAERERTREKMAALNDADDSEFYALVVFGNAAERETFMAAIGKLPAEKYLSGRELAHKLHIDLSRPEDEA